MNQRLEATLSILVTVCAVAVAAAAVYRHLTPPERFQRLPPTVFSEWDELLGNGRRFGPPNAPVTVLEFTDFQCPFCRGFHSTLLDVMKQRTGAVAVELFHFPLSMHESAVPAALAADCSSEQGRFTEMVDVLFRMQDSLGSTAWTELARRAGVNDTIGFVACLSSDSIRAGIEVHRNMGRKHMISGTPTVIINGWRYSRPPSRDTLIHIIDEVKKGRSPFPSTGLRRLLLRVFR